MEAFAYFHAAPTGTINGLYLTVNRGAKKSRPTLAPMRGTQQGTGPDWSKVGTTNYRHFDKEAEHGN